MTEQHCTSDDRVVRIVIPKTHTRSSSEMSPPMYMHNTIRRYTLHTTGLHRPFGFWSHFRCCFDILATKKICSCVSTAAVYEACMYVFTRLRSAGGYTVWSSKQIAQSAKQAERRENAHHLVQGATCKCQ